MNASLFLLPLDKGRGQESELRPLTCTLLCTIILQSLSIYLELYKRLCGNKDITEVWPFSL